MTRLSLLFERGATALLAGIATAPLLTCSANPALVTPGPSWSALAIQSQVTQVNPFTGLVFYNPSDDGAHMPSPESRASALEFSEFPYSAVVDKQQNEYDWSAVEAAISAAASRNHHSILRFWTVYPGRYMQTRELMCALAVA